MSTADTQTAPLARALAARAAAQFDDLQKAKGVDASTFKALAARASDLHRSLEGWGLPERADAAIKTHRDVLEDVSRLLADPRANAIPPSNDRIYAAVLDITELAPIVHALGPTAQGRDAVRDQLAETDPVKARSGRLALAFSAVCRRGGLKATPPRSPGEPVTLDLDGWRLDAAPCIPGDGETAADAARRGRDTLAARKRPGLLLLEAGTLLPLDPITVAEDALAISRMNERLETFTLAARQEILDAIGDEQAFGLVTHATLPATNAVSKRLIFAECLRAVNLCDAEDPRADGFRVIAEAMSRAG